MRRVSSGFRVFAFTGLAAAMTMLACAAGHTGPGSTNEDVTFQSGSLILAGTLSIPKGAGPFPAAVLIHGSGETDRSSLDHFRKMLVRNGVAALAYDKRGVGESQGPEFAWRDFNFDDLAEDAAAAVAFLRTNLRIDPADIGLFAASQGGWVAPLTARSDGNLAFMVIISASVTTVAEDNLFERDARLRKEGFTDAEIAEVHEMHLVDQEVSRSGMRYDEFVTLWNANKNKRWFSSVYRGTSPMPPNDPWRRWYRTVMDFDPVPVLQELPMPVLWLFGDPDLDRFGPVRTSLAALETLEAAGKGYEVHSFPRADHSLVMANGDDDFYEEILANWLGGH